MYKCLFKNNFILYAHAYEEFNRWVLREKTRGGKSRYMQAAIHVKGHLLCVII